MGTAAALRSEQMGLKNRHLAMQPELFLRMEAKASTDILATSPGLPATLKRDQESQAG